MDVQVLEPTRAFAGGVKCMPLVRSGNEELDKRQRVLIAFGQALDEFRRLNPSMPVAQIQAFLVAAVYDNLSMSEIANRTGSKVSTTSRYLLDLGIPRTDSDPAVGLIERGVDPMEPRRASYELSRKGKALVNRLVEKLSAICDDGDACVDLPGKEQR